MLSGVTTPQDLDERFRAELTAFPAPTIRRDPDGPLHEATTLTGTLARRLFDAQLASRHLDLAARWLRSFDSGFYTIGSAGHEGDAAVAAALRPDDPALLHYRSGAFYCARADQVPGSDPIRDVLRGLVASAREPIAGGRHKVLGHADLNIVPTTSTIASHLPRAVGLAFGLEWGRRAARRSLVASVSTSSPATPSRAGSSVSRPGQAGSSGSSATAAESPGSGPGGSAPSGSGPGGSAPSGSGPGGSAPSGSGPGGSAPSGSGPGGSAASSTATSADRGGSAGSEPGGAVRPGAGPNGGPGQAEGSGGSGGSRPWPADAIVVCSFGDASVNHASATAALNTAGWCDHTGLRLPVLFVCEDNGIGISVRSPNGWVAGTLRARPGLRYFATDGCDLAATYDAALDAANWVRRHRRPAVLHLSVVRLMGHAGADAEQAYRAGAELAADLERDPLVATARLLVNAGIATPAELLARYDEIGWQVRRVAEEVLDEPKLASAAEVTATLAPRRPVRVARALGEAVTRLVVPATDRADAEASAARVAAFAGRLPEDGPPLTLAQTINATLTDGLLMYPQMIVFGEDVAAKGGVYGVTKGLRDRFGASRVFDTLLDETSILGLALGSGLAGMLPVPEIQYLAYLHNAEDQLRGEASTLQFFSSGAYRNPMVVRVAGLAYQSGFGGHFHNDNAVAVLRDIPGLVVAAPGRAEDAGPMLRTCLAAALVDGTVSVFLEPIALYHTRDLYADGDGGWLARYARPGEWSGEHVPIGRARVYSSGTGEDLTIITFGNGVRMSLRVAERLSRFDIGCRVVDLRWLSPLPVADIIRESSATGRVLVVDETRRSGGVGEGILAALVDAGYVGVARRVAAIDSFIPLGPAAAHVLVSEDQIAQGARSLLAR
jgi:2-oxoisovalerate dehydrogenase E1 component